MTQVAANEVGSPTGQRGGERRIAKPPVGTLTRPDLLALMRRAGVFVVPALYEPFGLAALEAASGACPLVLADIPSLRELWMGGRIPRPT